MLAQARNTISVFPKNYSLCENLGTEVLLARTSLAATRRGVQMAGFPLFNDMSPQIKKIMLDGGEARVLQSWRALYKAEQKAQGNTRLFLASIPTIIGEYLDQKNMINWVTAVFLPDLPLICKKILQSEAYTALLQNTVILLEQKHASGKFLANPRLLTDPFTGSALHYRLQNNGFLYGASGRIKKTITGEVAEEVRQIQAIWSCPIPS